MSARPAARAAAGPAAGPAGARPPAGPARTAPRGRLGRVLRAAALALLRPRRGPGQRVPALRLAGALGQGAAHRHRPPPHDLLGRPGAAVAALLRHRRRAGARRRPGRRRLLALARAGRGPGQPGLAAAGPAAAGRAAARPGAAAGGHGHAAAALLRHVPVVVRGLRAGHEPRRQLRSLGAGPAPVVAGARRPGTPSRAGPRAGLGAGGQRALAERPAAAVARAGPAGSTGPRAAGADLARGRRRGRHRTAHAGGLRPGRPAADAGLEGHLRQLSAGRPAPRRRLPAPRPPLSVADVLLVAPRPALLDAGAVARRAGAARLRAPRAWPGGAAAGAGRPDGLRQRLLGRLVGRRLVLEPALRLAAAARGPGPGAGPRRRRDGGAPSPGPRRRRAGSPADAVQPAVHAAVPAQPGAARRHRLVRRRGRQQRRPAAVRGRHAAGLAGQLALRGRARPARAPVRPHGGPVPVLPPEQPGRRDRPGRRARGPRAARRGLVAAVALRPRPGLPQPRRRGAGCSCRSTSPRPST